MELVKTISGKATGFRASALTPKLYRMHTGRDLLLDFQRMADAVKAGRSSTDALSVLDDFAYILARQYAQAHGETIAASADEWMDEYEMLDIYPIYPELVQLWAQSAKTTSTPQKKTNGKR